MKKNLFLWRILLSTLAFGTVRAEMAILYGVRTGSQASDTVRIVLDVSRSTPISVRAPDLHTLIVQMPAQLSPHFTTKNQSTLIKNIHISSSTNPVMIQFTCRSPYQIHRKFYLPPNGVVSTRYVVDLVLGLAPQRQKIPRDKPESLMPLPSVTKKTIVIDAGHGGRDPGSQGPNHLLEKTITLSIAKKLSQKLHDTGLYTCVLTRSDDTGITLAQRLRIVRQANGDLFLSIHADSSPHPDTRGLSLYTLSHVASDREAARLAQKENKADINLGIDFKNELPEISDILIDLTKRETMNLSTSAVKDLLKELSQNVFLLRRPHRFADFVVLRSPHIPSILIELGFLSNTRDAHLLSDPDYQDKLCNSIVRGINHHFEKRT